MHAPSRTPNELLVTDTQQQVVAARRLLCAGQRQRQVMYQCPCCDHFTIGAPGQYDICLVCYREDDGLDVDEIDEHSGPNHLSLREGRRNFAQIGACDQKAVAHVLAPKKRAKFKYEPRSIVQPVIPSDGYATR